MTTIPSRPGNVFEPVPEAPTGVRGAGFQEFPRQSAPERPAAPTSSDLAQIAERRAALRAAADAASNSGGLGSSAEEITFGTSERAELETHDESRDARERQDERIEALMRIGAIQAMLKQLTGEQGFACIQQRAQRFALLWAQGRSQQAIEELDANVSVGAERKALFHMALDQLPPGADVGSLNALMEDLACDPHDTVRALMRTAVSKKDSPAAKGALAPNSPLLSLLQSPLTPKLVLDAATGLGREGLGQLEAMAVRPGRVDGRLSSGRDVFLSLTLLRTIQQLRQVEQTSVGLMKAGAAGPCPAADNPEEVRKTARWLLETTFAPAPQSALARMGTVLKVNGEALARARREMQRELRQLPDGVWLNADTKQLVSNELKNANTANLEHHGLLTRAGLSRRTDRPTAPGA
ncbi:MAG: hypothetical protein EOP37_08920 [Rubrivivax sp.]|nr:MAG: hypothetical protein EOP37_08920 [Rubrivivax sp.]